MNYKYDIFISYSHRDRFIAKIICKVLDDQGITYYIDSQTTKDQEDLPTVLVEKISNSRLLLFMASQNSYESPFAVKELVYAFNNMSAGRIVVYKIDNAPLPSNIEFISNNVVKAEESLVIEKLVDNICKRLGRDVKNVDWDSYEKFSWLDSDAWAYTFLIGLGLLGLCASVCAGLWFHSVLMGIGTAIGMVGVWITVVTYFMFTEGSEKILRTKTEKMAYVLTALLGLAGSLMIPVSTWIGIMKQSWGTGLLWTLGSWVVVILLMVIANFATSNISVGSAPLMKMRRWGKTYDLYLCYNMNDLKIVERIRTELLRSGFTFLESNNNETKRAVNSCRGFLYIGSRNSYYDDKCNRQLAYGFTHRRPILAYAVDQIEMPEDKKMAFSNSNILSLETHPIETKLMTDLRSILAESSRGRVVISSSFWRSLILSVLYTLAIVSIFVFSYLFGSVGLGITIFLNLTTVWTIISEAKTKRNKYIKTASMEVTLVDSLFIILYVTIPLLVWWLMEPGWVLSSFLVLIIYVAMLNLSSAYEYAAKTSPIGKLSPKEVQQYFDVFISYSRKDSAVADEVCNILDSFKISYFIDRQGIPGGSEFPTVLADAIQNCALVLFIMSENSFQSKFCQRERLYTEEQKWANERMCLFLNDELLYRVMEEAAKSEEALAEIKKETMIVMKDNWKQALSLSIAMAVPNTRKGRIHKKLLESSSRSGLIKGFMVKSVKENLITTATMLTLAISMIAGHYTLSWGVGLGLYSIFEPLLIYIFARKCFINETCVFVTSGIAVGLLVHSVWLGIGAGFAVLMLGSWIEEKYNDKKSK